MPELPELEVLQRRISTSIRGKRIEVLRILKPYVLKKLFEGDLADQIVKDVKRRGKYLIIETDSHCLIVHLMLRGALKYYSRTFKPKRSTAALLEFTDGTALEFSEGGSQKRMMICITPIDKSPARIANLGIEPFSDAFTVAALGLLLKKERKQLKVLLCCQSKIAGIGNAYADEILWKAGLSPFKMSTNLTSDEIQKLHNAIIGVLKWAIQEVLRTRQMDKRDFLRIHGRNGQPCPVCGDNIESVSFSKSDTYYCPTCQTAGKKLKDRRMSKFFR